jgi:hypothetical protein
MSLFKKKSTEEEKESLKQPIQEENTTPSMPEENNKKTKKRKKKENEVVKKEVVEESALEDDELVKASVKDPGTSAQPSIEVKDIPEDILRYDPEINEGLTNEQVEERKLQNLVNIDNTHAGKTTWQILSSNIFTFFNMLLLSIGIVLIVFGQANQTFFLAIAFANTLIGIIQELKAKKTLEKLKLVTSSQVTVVRNGKSTSIPTTELVLDDVYKLKNGDQIPTDSIILDGTIEVNESLLTGESLPIKKTTGEKIYAGSFLVSGSATVKASYIGEFNYISGIQAKAKELNTNKSELVRSLNAVIKIISLIIIPLGILTFITQWIKSAGSIPGPWQDYWFQIAQNTISKTAGSMVGMIPAGMYLLTSIALANSVIALSKKKAMVQDLYSIEMLARVDTLCLDKTGTLTDGTMRVDEIVTINKDYNYDDLIGSYLNAFNESNQTSIALSQRFPLRNTHVVIDKIPFSSARKFSVVEFKELGTFALGAPEYLYKGRDKTILEYIANKESSGYRVVMLCHCDNSITRGEIKGKFTPVCIFSLEDHIRLEAPDTIKWFTDNMVNVKIISGDNPLTASEIARKCGVPNAEKCISLEGLSEKEVTQIVNDYTVFGRVTPDQKALIIKTLKNEGHTVGMTGDGVNDILAMKSSDCSVAMANGSSAARNVAHLVLLDSNFASMPVAVQEGRRCINNVQNSSALYLMKTIFTIVFTIIVLFTFTNHGNGIDYPFKTNNLIIMESICIGLTSVCIALQKNDQPMTGHFLKNTFVRAVPAALCLIFAVAINYILRYSNNFFELPLDNLEKANEMFETFNTLTVTIIALAMSYNCFLPITPIKKYWHRTLLFIGIFILCMFAIFGLPFIPDFNGEGNFSINFLGIDFRYLNKTMWLVLLIYAAGSVSILAALTHFAISVVQRKDELDKMHALKLSLKEEVKETKAE